MEYFDWQFNEDTGGIWTGRHDMYGNKIYEGDKVQTTNNVGIVRYNPKFWWFEVANDDESFDNVREPDGVPEVSWRVVHGVI